MIDIFDVKVRKWPWNRRFWVTLFSTTMFVGGSMKKSIIYEKNMHRFEKIFAFLCQKSIISIHVTYNQYVFWSLFEIIMSYKRAPNFECFVYRPFFSYYLRVFITKSTYYCFFVDVSIKILYRPFVYCSTCPIYR